MFFGQAFLIVPVLIFLNRKKLPIIESLRINPISKQVTIATIFLSIGAMILADEINILVDMVIPAPDSFQQLEALLTPDNPISLILLITNVFISFLLKKRNTLSIVDIYKVVKLFVEHIIFISLAS